MYRLQLLLFINSTDNVLAKPTVIVPKSISFGLIAIKPSLPAPIISRSHLTAYNFYLNYYTIYNILLSPSS
jgi:hypothetical protein